MNALPAHVFHGLCPVLHLDRLLFDPFETEFSDLARSPGSAARAMNPRRFLCHDSSFFVGLASTLALPYFPPANSVCRPC